MHLSLLASRLLFLSLSHILSSTFSKCHAHRKTPYDPNLPHVFDGDEFAKYARLWTRGYDVYTPR